MLNCNLRIILSADLLWRIGFNAGFLKTAAVLVFTCHQTFAESHIPPIDDRCEITRDFVSFDKKSFRLCDSEVNECTAARMSRFNESEDLAQDQCWRLPLAMDPDFDGPCPEYMNELELEATTDRESLMRLVLLRNYFSLRNEFGAEIDVFKRSESLRSIHSFLVDHPNDAIALKLLRWTLLYTDDLVESLNVDLKIQGIDPDCPNSRNIFLHGIYQRTSEIVENWLAGQGAGAELTATEMQDLLLRVQQTLLNAYDLAIENSDHIGKLYWALESISDAILTREFENFQLVSRYVEIGLDDYADNRRSALIRRFSNEYDFDSHHGRSQSLKTMCSSYALELGLLDHCAELINHFGLLDSSLNETPTTDWTRAAISLMIGLTRDCSDHADWLLHGPSWWNVRRCIAEHKPKLATDIRELLERFSNVGESAEKEVLKAFLHLDDATDERFSRAADLDSAVVLYATRLIKRLHRIGDADTALNVLASIDAEMTSKLPSREKDLLDKTSKALNDGKYQNWMEPFLEL